MTEPEVAAVYGLARTLEERRIIGKLIAASHAAAVTGDVEGITGKRPRSFEAFVRENAAPWR